MLINTYKKIKMIIDINDDFDLDKIENSGQIFRTKVIDGYHRFILRDNVLYIKPLENNKYDVLTNSDTWNKVWLNYFDLETNYKEIRKRYYRLHPFVDKSMDYGKGIRILKQDPLEILLTFILAQRKSIPSIKNNIEAFSNRFGKKIETSLESVSLFPTIDDLKEIALDDLEEFKLGYRTPYIYNAIDKLRNNEIDLDELNSFDSDILLAQLKKLNGVGDKISNCIALYSYNRKELAPVDIWIQKVIKENFNNENIFYKFNEHAGVIQQYLFYYKRNRKRR